jgi:hypothetical protein
MLLVVLAGAGCADTTKLIRLSPPSAPLDRNLPAFIATSRDGAYGSQRYGGSGRTTSLLLARALSPHVSRCETADVYSAFEVTLGEARRWGARYLFVPAILHWEDRATEWSGKPDKVEVRIDVYDAQSGIVIHSALVTGQSGLATFGGDHPQDLLPGPFDEFARSLFK